MSEATYVSADGTSPPATLPVTPPSAAKASPDLTDFAKDFLKEEHKQRRQEIGEIRARMDGDIRNGLILTGAIWSWLATNQAALAGHGHFDKVVVFMPGILMAFFFYRWHAMHKSIFVNAEYLQRLEDKAGVTPLGWETWLQDKRAKEPSTANLVRTGRTFWSGLLVANLLLAVLFGLSRG